MCSTPIPADGPRFCPEHESLKCAHCRGHAVGYCGALKQDGAGRCREPLCERCEHRPGGQHGRRESVRDTARQELVSSIEMVLDDMEADGEIVVNDRARAAAKIVDHLSMHITLKVLSGMAQPPN